MEAYCVNFLFKRNRIKYIPNDLIKFKGKLHEIIEADEYFVKIWYKGGKKPKYLRVRVNDVTPIPLSDDVFRVNEWRIVNRTDEGEVLRNRDIIVIKDICCEYCLKDMIKELLVVDGIESAYTDFDYVNKYNVNIFITYDDTIINEEKLIDLKNKFNG